MQTDLKDVSEWTIFIDDVQGELAMDKREEQTGREIAVLSKEEILPKLKELEHQLLVSREASKQLGRMCREESDEKSLFKRRLKIARAALETTWPGEFGEIVNKFNREVIEKMNSER